MGTPLSTRDEQCRSSPVERLDLDKLCSAREGSSGTPPIDSAGNGPEGAQPPSGRLRRMVNLELGPDPVPSSGSGDERIQALSPPQPPPSRYLEGLVSSSAPQLSCSIAQSPEPSHAKRSPFPNEEASWVREHDGRYLRACTPIAGGAYGAVYRGRALDSGEYVAIKVYRITGDGSEREKHAYHHFDTERRALQLLARRPHENIVRMLAHYFVDHSPRIVIEYCETSLLEVLCADVGGTVVLEAHYREVMRRVFSAVAHCMDNGVYHMDVKLENILFARNPLVTAPDSPTLMRVDQEALKTVKLIDWGFAVIDPISCMLGMNPRTDAYVGSVHYCAPEVGAGCYDAASAVSWSLGVCLFACIERRLPWGLVRDESIKDRAAGVYVRRNNNVSDHAVHLLSGLLQVQPCERFSVKYALTLEWFAHGARSGRSAKTQSNASEEECGGRRNDRSEPIDIPPRARTAPLVIASP